MTSTIRRTPRQRYPERLGLNLPAGTLEKIEAATGAGDLSPQEWGRGLVRRATGGDRRSAPRPESGGIPIPRGVPFVRYRRSQRLGFRGSVRIRRFGRPPPL